MKRKELSIDKKIVDGLILSVFVVFVFIPIFTMLRRITTDGFISIINSAQFPLAIKNSMATTLVSTVLSISLAFIASWCIERINIKHREIFEVLFTVPMLVPSISHAFGLVALFGSNGILTNLLKLNFSIYGFWGIVVGSVMYSFPVAFLMFLSILEYENGMPYKAAEVLGIPKFNQFIRITLPYIKRTIISAFFSVFTMIVTDYGVPLMIGGKTITLSVMMYNKSVAMLDYNSGSVIGSFLLLPAIIAFVVDLLNSEKTTTYYINDKVEKKQSLSSRLLSYSFCLFISICVVMPIASFLTMVFETKYPINTTFTVKHIISTINKGSNQFLLNSILYSLLTAIFGTVFAFVCAYANSRMKNRISKYLHLISLVSMAIPGIVLGLSYVMFFHDKYIYGGLFIIVIVNSIHFFSSPYLLAYGALEKLNMNLEAVGLSLGIKRINIIIDVIIPKMKHTITEMMSYFFINSMMTISAVSFLAPPSPKPIALMINQFEAQLLMESAAFVTLIILITNITIKVFFAKIANKLTNNSIS